MSQYFTCPVCGAAVPIKARACPECGSDKETGWSEAAQYVHLLPDRGDSGGYPQQTLWRNYVIPGVVVVCILAFLVVQGWGWALSVVPLLAFVIGLIIWLKRRSANSTYGLERQAYQQLLQRAAGDRAIVDRLLAYEQNRAPDATRLQLLQNAIYRWDRDRHEQL